VWKKAAGGLRVFESAEIAFLGTDKNKTGAHTLGVVPSGFQVVIRCKVADADYVPGDEVDLRIPAGTQVFATWASSTAIGITSVNAFSSAFLTYIPSKAGAYVTLTAGRWVMIFRAFAP
jgi:hypothetical protein